MALATRPTNPTLLQYVSKKGEVFYIQPYLTDYFAYQYHNFFPIDVVRIVDLESSSYIYNGIIYVFKRNENRISISPPITAGP